MVGGGRPHRAPPAGNGGITRTGSMETWVVTRRRSGRMADGEDWDLTASACHRGGELPFLGLAVHWFGIITRQSIRRGTFTSVTVLVKQIRDYIDHWNADSKPFVWTATADDILAKVQLVQTNIKKLVDNNAK
jgi:hypothetical protein